MVPEKIKCRLFVDAGLAEGGPVELGPEQTHYLVNVMRFGAGDMVALFNGKDGEWSAAIGDPGKNRSVVTPDRLLREQTPEPGPWLAFSPLKKARSNFLVEKATELGVSRLCPVITRHTQSARINRDRMKANAIEAAEQSERLTVPEITEPETLEKLMAGWPSRRRLMVLDETGGGRPIAQVLSDLQDGNGADPVESGFLSGPEGGFDAGELDALRKLDFVTAVDLGPRTLRAETAALAALACWQAVFNAGR